MLDGRLQYRQYLAGGGHDDAPGQTMDALELLARVLAHIPDPKRHLVRYYGAYSNLVRGKRKDENQRTQGYLFNVSTITPRVTFSDGLTGEGLRRT